MKARKNSILFLLSVFLIVVFFFFPQNQVWLKEKVLHYWSDFQVQKNNTEIEHRKILRYKSSYTYSKQVADFLKSKANYKNFLVLIPSAPYFKKFGINYNVPEPAVFYYYTGIKTTWPGSNVALNANWYVHVIEGTITIDSIGNINDFKDSIDLFKKYE